VLSSLLTGAPYSHLDLRPDQVLVISKVTNNKIIEITINGSHIDHYAPTNTQPTPVLKSNKKEQYELICLLASSLGEAKQKAEDNEIDSLSAAQKHKLKSLSYSQLINLVNTATNNIVDLYIHTKSLEMAIFVCKQQNKKNQIIEKLIRAGATKKFMYMEYAVTPQKYKFLRSAFNLDKAFGRPRILSEQECHKVYDIWQKNKGYKIGEIYLKIHEEINKGLNKSINIRNIATAIDQIMEQTV